MISISFWEKEGIALEDLAIKHKDFGDRFDDPEQCIGYKLCDAVGEKVGTVEKLFVSD